jgi:uncharacterized protein YjiK
MMRKFIQMQCPLLLCLIAWAVTLCTGCANDAQVSPPGYNFRKAKKMELGKVLNEISGLYYNTDDKTLLGISDSKGKIFIIDPSRRKLRDFAESFSIGTEQPDYEDLVKVGDTVYALISDGTLVAIPKGAKDTSGTRVYRFWSTDKNDFETLYYDPTAKSLVMICKTCEHEKSQDIRTAYRFDMATKTFDSTEFFTLNNKEVKALVKKDDADFKPSGAAIHPINKRLYILASAGNLLVVADTRGKVIEAYNLNPDEHPQAEGIAFAPDGTMYISNEGKYGKPTLLMYPYHQTGK